MNQIENTRTRRNSETELTGPHRRQPVSSLCHCLLFTTSRVFPHLLVHWILDIPTLRLLILRFVFWDPGLCSCCPDPGFLSYSSQALPPRASRPPPPRLLVSLPAHTTWTCPFQFLAKTELKKRKKRGNGGRGRNIDGHWMGYVVPNGRTDGGGGGSCSEINNEHQDSVPVDGCPIASVESIYSTD